MNALVIEKKEFENQLTEYVLTGSSLKKEFDEAQMTTAFFLSVEKKYKLWEAEVSEFLKTSLEDSGNELFRVFNNAGTFTNGTVAASQGVNPDGIQFRARFLPEKLEAKIEALEIIIRVKTKFLEESALRTYRNTDNANDMKKIFISHSSKDEIYVEKVISIVEAIGVQSGSIFCSSIEGYGIKLGENFLEVLKNELNGNVLVIFVISNNFYASPVCLCEMGAAWVKTTQHIPILVPPFSYSDIKGVFPTTQGMLLNEKQKFNNLKNRLESFMEIDPVDLSIWERKRDRIHSEIETLVGKKKIIRQ